MSSNDTIRAALEAAHKARIANQWQRTRRMFQHGAQLEPGEDGLADTAVAIVTFLRALPDHVAVRDPVYPCSHTLLPVVRDGLARAVEEAAHD